MKASYRWLRALVPDLDADPDEVAARLALRGAPVESIERPAAGLGDVVVGRVLEVTRHPNADRLSLCRVDAGTGGEPLHVVCGAPNVRAGAWYPFAPVGATLPGDFRIRKAKIRGEVSEGMLCSAKELRLGTDHSGILELHGDFRAGQPFVEALDLDDATLEVEVTANRGDLLSHVGLARELASGGDGRVALPPVSDGEEPRLEWARGAPRVEAGPVSVEVREPDLCPRYLGAVVRGVRVGPSPTWLQARLRGAGARPINNVVDATNYVMLELGQPLHAFDLGRLAGPGIVVRRPAAGEERFTTLDDVERALGPDMLLICDADRPVAVAGVMGGRDSEVGPETTDLLIECAWFDPKSIRATRRALGLSTDASYRFERGIDPEAMERALARCVEIVLAVAGGEIDGPVLDCAPRAHEPAAIPLRLARIEQVLGVRFEAARVRSLLAPLGFEVAGEEEGILRVRVPGWRSLDVTREIDLVEEVARTHGYDAFPAELGAYRPNRVPDDPLFQLHDELRGALAARGLFEAQTPAFVPAGEGDVEVANPLAATEPFVRATLLPSLVRRVEHNLARGNRDVRLFELGTSFRRAGSGEPPVERPHLAVVLTGRRRPPHWSVPDEPLDVFDLKAVLEEVVARAWRGSARVEPEGAAAGDGHPFEPGATMVVRDEGGEVLGRAGRIRADRVDAPPWAGPVWGLELALPDEPAPAPVPVYVPLPQLPASERDVALLVPVDVAAGAVTERVREAGGPQLEHVEIFDLYRGAGVPPGHRSLAYRLRFRAPDRTLEDREVDAAMARILERLEAELGVRVRG